MFTAVSLLDNHLIHKAIMRRYAVIEHLSAEIYRMITNDVSDYINLLTRKYNPHKD
jgi:hypothetical protein